MINLQEIRLFINLFRREGNYGVLKIETELEPEPERDLSEPRRIDKNKEGDFWFLYRD